MAEVTDSTEMELIHALFNISMTLLQYHKQTVGFEEARIRTVDNLQSTINMLKYTNEDNTTESKENKDNER